MKGHLNIPMSPHIVARTDVAIPRSYRRIDLAWRFWRSSSVISVLPH
ncbi:hypothetical protein OH687_29335 [Burkholderia anthina]|nr:hypothetical protein OH687_29335 [Burkholderia anthina]